MANRSFRDEPPSACSSSEMEVEENEEETQDEEEEEQEEKHSPPPPLPKKDSQTQPSDSETESEPDREQFNRTAKPSGKTAPANPDRKKRSAEESISNGEACKRVKTESNSEAEKKHLFQRIWSESDEMEVLKGLIEFSERKKDNPVYDANDLYQFIKKKIQTSISKQQLMKKVSSLKKKFMGYEKKVSKGTKLKPQEETFFQLARKIWDSAETTVKRESDVPPIVERKDDGLVSGSHWFLKEIVGLCRNGSVSEDFIRKGMDLVDVKKRAELDKRWRKLQAKELEIVLERTRLIQEQAALIGQAINH